MTTGDHEVYPIWHGVDSKDTPASCDRLMATLSCATSKRGEEDWEQGRGSSVMKSRGYREWQVNGGGKKSPEPSHFLIKHSRLWLQHVTELQMSIMQLDVVRGATRWTCIKSMEPQEISDYFVRLPLQWLGFCNQRMQIRTWQPINHNPAVMYRAAWHVPADMARSPFALRHLSAEGIRKILGAFHFHLHFSGRVGRLSQDSSVSGTTFKLPVFAWQENNLK